MKTCLLLGLLLVAGSVRGQAQQGPATVVASSQPVQAMHADSVAVLRQVFRKARRSGRFGALLYTGLLTTQLANASHLSERPYGLGLTLAGAGADAGLITLSIIDWVRFSQRREESAISRFEQRQPLPRYVQRRMAHVFARLWAREQSRR